MCEDELPASITRMLHVLLLVFDDDFVFLDRKPRKSPIASGPAPRECNYIFFADLASSALLLLFLGGGFTIHSHVSITGF